MPIAQILLASRGGTPAPTYTLTPFFSGGPESVNEGSVLQFKVGGTNVPDGTYYWTIETNAGDFATTSGTVSVTGTTGPYLGNIDITPTADETTEVGAETFTVALREGSITGTILATSVAVTINDTSQTLVPPFSLNFPVAGNPYLLVSNTQTDWNLGTTYTIEYWSKTNRGSSGGIQTVMSQGPDSGKIDLGYAYGHLLWSNSEPTFAEPTPGGRAVGAYNIGSPGGWNGVGTPGSWQNLATTGGSGTGLTISVAGATGGYANALAIVNPGSGYTEGDSITAVGESSISFNINVSAAVWTHVAWVRESGSGNIKLYYNGLLQTNFSAGPALSDGSSDLNIGRRAGVNGQGFKGKLAMIRISNTAKYLADFSPSVSYGVSADTRLMLGSNNPLVDLSTYELNGITTSQSNGSTIYFSKATYPNLNNQVKAGDTVVDAGTSASSTVTAAVYTADPDNWGINVSSYQGPGAKNFSGPGEHPISVQGAVTLSDDFPSFQSLQFSQILNRGLLVDASSDWNLGTTWTIEFWIKAPRASNGVGGPQSGIWGLLNQGGWSETNCIVVALSNGELAFLSGSNANDDVRYTEPTPNVWTHVAIVNYSGTQRVWYNGSEQTKISGNFGSASYTNSTNPLYIGRLGPANNSPFDGKLALVRISNTAKYVADFTATTTYIAESDTKLFLNKVTPTVDVKAHTITDQGISLSTDFPT